MKGKRSAFTLVELLFVIGFFFLITGFVVNALVETTQIQNVTGAQSDMQRQSHHRLDQMVHDIQESQLVLSSYTGGGTTYTSDTNRTLVLQAPSYDSSGNALGTSDIIVYTLSAGTAPHVLYKDVFPATGSSRKAETNYGIADNVESMTLTYLADDGVTGDGSTKVFTTNGVPVATPSVVENGATLSSPTQYTFTSPQTVTFTTAPTGPDAVDLTYQVSPAVSPSQVCTVDVDLQLQQTSMAFQAMAKTQTVEIDSRANLRNH